MIAISSTEVLDLSTLVQRLREQLPQILDARPIRLAYLYGSAAVDATTPLSDIDIALVAGQPLSAAEQLDLELEVQVEFSHKVGIRNADVRLVDRTPLLLRGQALGHGISVYARDAAFRIDFETRARDEYFDYKPLARAERDSFLQGDKMINREKVESLIRQQRDYVKHLQALAQPDQEQFIADPDKTGAAKYYFLVAIETCIDIGNHIISAENFRAPVDYADVFTVLGEQKILPPEFARALEKMTGFRNRLVHVYAEVDDRVVHELLRTRLGDFDRFQKYVLERVMQNSVDS